MPKTGSRLNILNTKPPPSLNHLQVLLFSSLSLPMPYLNLLDSPSTEAGCQVVLSLVLLQGTGQSATADHHRMRALWAGIPTAADSQRKGIVRVKTRASQGPL